MTGCVECGSPTSRRLCSVCETNERLDDDLQRDVTDRGQRPCVECRETVPEDEGSYDEETPGLWRCYACQDDSTEDVERGCGVRADGGPSLAWTLDDAREEDACYVCGDDADVTRDGVHSRRGEVEVPLCGPCDDTLGGETDV